MKSKSSTRFNAAMVTITMLMPMPSQPASCMKLTWTPNSRSTNVMM